jgi:hypothetical protein
MQDFSVLDGTTDALYPKVKIILDEVLLGKLVEEF